METQKNTSAEPQGDKVQNKNKKQRSSFAYSRMVFIEYVSAKKGQHSITVMTTLEGRRKIIGRIFKEYDEELKKYRYTAKDREGNILFEPTVNLYELKNKFIAEEKNLSHVIPKEEAKEVKQDLEQPNRKEDLAQLRKGKETKEKEIER